MSQHFYQANSGHVVLAGYDRQCGEYFFSIFESEEAEFPIAESIGSPRDVQVLRESVDDLVQGVPQPMWESIRQDAINNVGNRVVRWNADGTIQSDSAAFGKIAA